ncbi:MAG: hypothetical protein LBO66_14515, partial [Deltaproteobacteria bacterium]|nr:hypothetical protein [Deltaproteobacteria bacterium]
NNELVIVGKEYIQNICENSVMKKRNQRTVGETLVQTFKISSSKNIIDKIDALLAKRYGFSDEELDYIINFDIKYRMGLVSGAANEEDL